MRGAHEPTLGHGNDQAENWDLAARSKTMEFPTTTHSTIPTGNGIRREPHSRLARVFSSSRNKYYNYLVKVFKDKNK